MNEKLLEQFYEAAILLRYGEILDLSKITWTGHGKVGLDAWAHYFKVDDRQYVLLYEDFPSGEYLGDGLSHEAIELNGEASFELKFSSNNKQVPNIIGWFTLFQEKIS